MSVAITFAQAMSTHNATGKLLGHWLPYGPNTELLLYENTHIMSLHINKYNYNTTNQWCEHTTNPYLTIKQFDVGRSFQ